MGLLNPAYGIILPFLFIFTLPIALFAGLTSFLAFSILLIRVILVYIELALAIVPHYLLGTSIASSALAQQSKSLPPTGLIATRRRKRRSSSGSNVSGTGSVTPVSGENNFLGFSQGVGPTRDFEGVGGWRLDNPSDDDALWTNINSRLELPADHGRRHHRRSLTSGSMPSESRPNSIYGPEALMNTSRARTPPSSSTGFTAEYFPQLSSSKGLKRNNSGFTALSGSSGSSKGSSIIHIQQR